MITMQIKPSFLPQISAPFNYTLGMLDNEGIDYKYMQGDPEDLIPLQGIVIQDKISEIKDIKPIWVSKDNYILDGHHRFASALSKGILIKYIKISLPYKEAIRVLNKIQDIFDYENQEKINDVVGQDHFNMRNDKDSGIEDDFLSMLEIDSNDEKKILHDNKKLKKITGYRKKDINEKSVVGNFFSLKESDGYNKYDMEFNSLLDTNELNLNFRSDSTPVAVLSKNWFPNVDFKKLGKKYDVKEESIMNRAVAEKAKKMGYDGIKYGDIMIQGF